MYMRLMASSSGTPCITMAVLRRLAIPEAAYERAIYGGKCTKAVHTEQGFSKLDTYFPGSNKEIGVITELATRKTTGSNQTGDGNRGCSYKNQGHKKQGNSVNTLSH